ncbi:MAG: leucyl aminopeptidase [Rhodomicrobiaceae bacterium]
MPANLDITFASLDEARGGVALALCEPLRDMPPALKALNERADGIVARAAEIAKFKGGKKDVLDIIAPAGLQQDRLFVIGLGSVKKYAVTDWLDLGGRIAARLSSAKITAADVLLETVEDAALPDRSSALIALGTMLRSYEFKKYKTKKKKSDTDEEEETPDSFALRFLCRNPGGVQAEFDLLRTLGDGVNMARDLVNEPANVLTPQEFANRAAGLSEKGLEVEILDQARLTEIGMGALLAVGQGSAQPSFVAIMRWNGADDPGEKPLLLVGKGVCFDTGGVSIKPAAGMEDMKGDMGGAAAVTGAMLALAGRKAKLNAVGIIGLTENMVSGTAQRPGDVVKTLSGQTVEVINTDAEGRLVLADIMWYAQDRFKPAAMVTLATLTGAIIIALGKEHAGLFSNDDDLAEQLSSAGYSSGEKVWRLPLHDKYNKLVNSKVADMKNVGGRTAGSITAAEFLQRFVMPDVAWAHLDIAGTAMAAPSTDTNQSWGSGYGVMLLNRLADDFYEKD